MNKEQILEAFYRERKLQPEVESLIETQPSLMTPESQEPCNFHCQTEEEDFHHHLDSRSEKSAYSEIGICLEQFQEVLQSRENRRIFATLSDNENLDVRVWFYKTSDRHTFGPFSARQMDDLFVNGKLNEDASIQSPTDFEFVAFRMVLRKYLKRLQVQKIKELKPPKAGFQKLNLGRNQSKTAGLLIERKYRVLSLEVKPNLSFLDEIVEDAELNEVIQTRGRSSTVGQ